jgi:Protein of unknown function (DUF742)
MPDEVEPSRKPAPLVRPFLREMPPAYPQEPDRSGDRPAPSVPAARPFLLTRGRTRPADSRLEIEAQVLTSEAGEAALERYRYEQRDIVALCRQPMSVAEIAARLGLHLGVTRVLVGDLVAWGHLSVRRPDAAENRSVAVIERVIRGLQAIH